MGNLNCNLCLHLGWQVVTHNMVGGGGGGGSLDWFTNPHTKDLVDQRFGVVLARHGRL